MNIFTLSVAFAFIAQSIDNAYSRIKVYEKI